MAKQKLTPKAKADKKKRDLAFAKTFARKKKKAENQRKRRAAIKACKNISGKDYDHKDNKFKSIKNFLVNIEKLRKNTIINLS